MGGTGATNRERGGRGEGGTKYNIHDNHLNDRGITLHFLVLRYTHEFWMSQRRESKMGRIIKRNNDSTTEMERRKEGKETLGFVSGWVFMTIDKVGSGSYADSYRHAYYRCR